MKKLLFKGLAALCMGAAVLPIAAQESKTVMKIVVPFNPGGGSDLFARLIAPGLSETLKATVIVENRAGAGGVIGADYVAKSKPDGNTLLLSDASAYAINPHLYPSLPYKSSQLQPVIDVARFANVLVVPAHSPYASMADIVRAAKQSPDKLTIASSGNGSSTHLTAVMMQRLGRFSLTHVPYKGSGPAFTDLLGGQVDMMFSGLPAVSEYIKGNKLKAVAIASARRSPFAPEVPTMAEAGLAGFESFISQGLFAPAGTPAETVTRINAAVNQLLSSPEMGKRLVQLKAEFQPGSAADYQKWLDAQSDTWARLIKDASIKID
ncbi:Bug family tripartite tricarboxylate transporter substrate binding protein [Variovorax terrae]|uniref:Tripartite tricarboxylate transporter substrate binding protein n=1 Tax=Variovorax terrae TaxID=2923278 RepID=A0A9X1VSW6_9BURK|nr:tripartite tricarboxylate transporter substrate binding protein [Variovorax terrae]MCJ0762474.1 tripartite tricarboxylate transporter substrate binding protein [Variovorax terrae]